jgi:formylglycine-generating enzyme required for sulfatase activity
MPTVRVELQVTTEEPFQAQEPWEEEVVVRKAGWFRKAITGKRTTTRTVTSHRAVTRATTATLEFCEVPAGTFLMGSEEQEPIHPVTLTRGFFLGRYPVTQAQWEAVMGSTPSQFPGADRPVEQVSWNDCQAFIERLNAARQGTFRLPTEAEWEYACRAGSPGRFCFGDDDALLEDYGWYAANSGGQTRPVGQKRPNPWGLHDMHGNVWEWCQDWYDEYREGPAIDPQGARSGLISARVFRGGCWRGGPDFAASAHRGGRGAIYRAGILGLRLAWLPAAEVPEPLSTPTRSAS